MPVWLPISVGILVVTIVGINLLLYGRHLWLRRIGALLSGAPGPCLTWLAGRILLNAMEKRLWLHSFGNQDVLIVGQDITLYELLWMPLQDAGFLILIGVALFGLSYFKRRKRSARAIPLRDGFALARWLDRTRESAKRAGIAYQVTVAATVILALPTTGLLTYATLQALLARGQPFLVKDWISQSALVAGMVYVLIYYIVNSIIAL